MIKPFLTKWPFLFKLRLFFVLVGLVIILSFLYLKLVPSGHIIYERDYSQTLRSGKGFILGFTPAERVDLSGLLPKIIGDPIYFSLFTPRTFDRAQVIITYRDHLSSSTPIIEMGVLKDKIVRNYDLQPIENKTLAVLVGKWTTVGTSSLILFQLGKNYADLPSFQKDLAAGQLKDCPGGPTTCLATYNYAPIYNFQMTGIKTRPLTLSEPLRGQHQFYVYVPAHDLRLDFDFVDMNQDKAQDPIAVNLYSANKLIDSRTLGDNNPDPTSGVAEQKKLSLSASNLKPGVYKAEIKISDDMVIKKIQSSVDRLSFINKVWPVSASGNLILYTDATYLLAKAFTPASLQTINFGGQDFSLNEPYQQFEFVAPVVSRSLQTIKLTKDDVILENNGLFSWSQSSFFDPTLKKVDNHFILGQTKYILADYQTPTIRDGWKTATAAFSLIASDRENGKYSFLLSIPGLKAASGDRDYLEIKSIKIELTGRTLGQKLKSLYGQN